MRTKLAILALASATILAGCTTPNPPPASGGGTTAPPSEALEAVPMITHVQFGVFEMDVFIEHAGAVGKVFRPTPAEAAGPLTKDADLWSTAQPTAHDPTFSNAGPFDEGSKLGVKLSDWLKAWGAAAYLCTGGQTGRIDAKFGALVPHGTYTFWNSRLDFTEGHITGAQDFPAGAADGSQNRFTADQDGNARFSARWDGCTPTATGGPSAGSPTGTGHVFAIAYHSDGKVYGADPGPFGQHTHVQLFGLVKAATQ